MQGSKYTDEFRANAVSMCAMPKKTITQVAKELNIPRATLYDWVRTAKDTDPDYASARRNKLRNLMDKAYSVASRSIDGLDKQSKILKLEKTQINKVISKLLSDDELDDKTRLLITEIIRNYTNTSMTDTVKISKESLAMAESLKICLLVRNLPLVQA